jgi:predicted TIM-barrel fold metal-dependent hydrolase
MGYYNPLSEAQDAHKPPSGGPAASDPDFVIADLIERHGLDYAILNSNLAGVSAIHDPDQGAAVASAYNDYVAELWLSRHDAFRASILVSANDPLLAAKEIERMAGHPKMVGVVIGSGQRAPLGQRQFHPIYEAAERHGLPIGIQTGSEGMGGTRSPTPSGYPARYLDWLTGLSQTSMAHMNSLVCEGVFEKFPRLNIVLHGAGFTWVPHLMWRLDKNFKGLRSQAPWLKRMPSEYIRDHFRFTTLPLEEPEHPEQLLAIFDMIGAENMLLFSSNYPYSSAEQERQQSFLRQLRPEVRQKIVYDNAKALYNL